MVAKYGVEHLFSFMLVLNGLQLTFAGCGRWGIQRYFAWIKNPKPMKEKKKEKLVRPNGHAPAVIGRPDEIFLPVDQS